GPDVAFARTTHLHAEFDIVERDLKHVLIEAANLIIDGLANGEASRGDDADVLDKTQALHVARRVAGQELMPVKGVVVDPGVLKAAVRIEELGAHAADFRTGGMGRHFRKPATVANFDIVVDKSEHASLRLARREIVERREVE